MHGDTRYNVCRRLDVFSQRRQLQPTILWILKCIYIYIYIYIYLFYSWFHLYPLLPFTYPHPRFPFPPFLPILLSFTVFPPQIPPLRMWPQPFSPMYRICTRAQGNCGKPVPIQSAIQQSPSLVYGLWKNDLPLSVSICGPQTGGHPSKYWPSAKLLDLCDCLVPDIYHTPKNFRD